MHNMGKKDIDKEHGGSTQELTSAAMKSLDDWSRELGAPDADVVEELYATVEPADLVELGRHSDSATLIDAMPAFLASVTACLTRLGAAQRAKLVGFDEAWLPVLARETVALRDVYARFSAQDAAGTRELAKRRRAAAEAWTACVAMRDQAVRNLRRALGSRAGERAQIDDAQGTAKTITSLVTGTHAVADTLAELLAEKDPKTGKPSALARLLVRSKLDAAYVAELRGAAKLAHDRDAAANATAAARVTQDDLDAHDGRVMRVVEWVWRAFREAGKRDAVIREPSLGAMEGLFVARRAAKDDAPPAPPANPT